MGNSPVMQETVKTSIESRTKTPTILQIKNRIELLTCEVGLSLIVRIFDAIRLDSYRTCKSRLPT